MESWRDQKAFRVKTQILGLLVTPVVSLTKLFVRKHKGLRVTLDIFLHQEKSCEKTVTYRLFFERRLKKSDKKTKKVVLKRTWKVTLMHVRCALFLKGIHCNKNKTELPWYYVSK